MGAKMFGARVPRLEDPRLLTGYGNYTDDFHLTGMLEAAFVRSPHSHAKIIKIDKTAALKHEGVVAIYTASDLPEYLRDTTVPFQVPNPAISQPFQQRLLEDREVCFSGEPIALIVADTRYNAEDAATLIEIEYEVLPGAADCKTSLENDAPLCHTQSLNNEGAKYTVGYGDLDAAFSKADLIHREEYWIHRGGGFAIENRAVVAEYDELYDMLTIWSATQSPFLVKQNIVDMLGWEADKVRVIAPDVGGGFGPKTVYYVEEALIPVIAKDLGRPVKWIEDRRENFLATNMERDQYWDMEIAVDRHGKLLGVRGNMIHDTGAYMPWGIISPYISATTLPGPYILPAYELETRVALTNKVAVTPVRGAGRPQAVFAMERLLDRAADKLDIDRAEIRRRNLIPKEDMPYALGLIFRDGKPMTYDSGDYPKCQAEAMRLGDYEGFQARQNAARAKGRHIGIGIANYVEGTGLGPFEGATVRIQPSGRICIYTGGGDSGQGHWTTLAQVCADKFGVKLEDIDVQKGDTGKIASGVGTFASRIAVNAGSSVHLASTEVREKAIKVAAHMLEAAEEDMDIENGRVVVKGSDLSVPLSDVARAVQGMPGFSLPGGVEPGLEATHYFSPSQSAYCNGTAVVEVEVDPDTGNVEILNYSMAHDSGTLINPFVVDGQVQGAVAQGVGNSLLEWMVYDDNANPVSATFAEYLLPSAPETPNVDVTHVESPTPINPLGVKGAGEGGTIPAAAAIIAAIEDALSPWEVRISGAPVTPSIIAEKVRAKA
ncbi:MAG: Caffeine dehydrogenase subunit alpha [Alphaproteobacteria bacterium MarineAlpha11_Bin1]|nr:MAG: Caffeine dehydrogenase subunit alpha [Alphaproteobacteria bacterium MarineAlpha11_Bin1]|tara:strand:+ start:11506 stop:13830 length:2325 start_codon:yes stop_codon:yes gene_type:complete